MTDAESELERRFLGMIEVDGGTLIVGDPVYSLRPSKACRCGEYRSTCADAAPSAP